VTVRSNKGAKLRRFEGNFGNAVSLASIKGNENCYRLTVWDHHKRRIFIYDVLQGEVDHSVHLTGFTDCVNAVTTLANDMTVFGSSRDKTLRIWRIPAQSIVRDDHVTNVSKDVISLVSIEDGVLSLSENGKLEKWTSNENKIWSSQLLMQMNCGENCKSEKMTSLAAIQLPKQERSKNDFLTSVEDDVYILAATCAEHCRVNLLVHSLQKTSRVRIELGQGNV
jgi:WD40 repeat protein